MLVLCLFDGKFYSLCYYQQNNTAEQYQNGEILGDGQAIEFQGFGAEHFEQETGAAIEDEHGCENLTLKFVAPKEQIENQANEQSGKSGIQLGGVDGVHRVQVGFQVAELPIGQLI